MKNMTLINIAKACNGKLYSSNRDSELCAKGVVIDSRLVNKDYVFIASKGEQVDGHDFINGAITKGALALVCERPPSGMDIPYILVEDSLLALKGIATWYRTQLSIPLIGITGSVGKTSTKEFISSVLSQKYRVLKTEGNYNNEIGLPLTILNIRSYHEVAVLEMGISDFNEMHRLSEIAKPDYCILTNIGQCHLENLGSRSGILKAKTEIFDFMNENGSVVINGDDDMLSTLHIVKNKRPISFGLSSNNDIYCDNISSNGLMGSSCNIHIGNNKISVNIPMPGAHMILNALAAATVGSLLGLGGKEIKQGIEQIQSLSGRNNIIRHHNWLVIDDCYNANPVSMKAALDLLAMADTRKVAILGDMGELGATEEELHKEIGIYAALRDIDIILCVGKLSIHMYQGALEVLSSQNVTPENAPEDISKSLFYFETKENLINSLPAILNKDDSILVKASHFMGFDKIVSRLLNEVISN